LVLVVLPQHLMVRLLVRKELTVCLAQLLQRAAVAVAAAKEAMELVVMVDQVAAGQIGVTVRLQVAPQPQIKVVRVVEAIHQRENQAAVVAVLVQRVQQVLEIINQPTAVMEVMD
tara:strand:- start:260 stop:604 length:345 start_codon:yes stop_codon:yes gene_type:complete